MEFDIHVYHHGLPDILALINQGKAIMSALDTLVAQVTANTTVTESAIALINGLKEKLDAAIASNDATQLQALSDVLGAETTKLATAVQANTPIVFPTSAPDPVLAAEAPAAATADAAVAVDTTAPAADATAPAADTAAPAV